MAQFQTQEDMEENIQNENQEGTQDVEQESGDDGEEVETGDIETDSGERRGAFGFKDETSRSDLIDDFQELGGDEGVDLGDQEMEKVPDDTSIDDLGKTGATDQNQSLDESLEREPPSGSESDSESEDHQPESSEAEAQDVPTDIDPEVLEIAQENPEKVKNLEKFETELTKRSQAISQLERLEQVRQLAMQDPGRRQKLIEVIERMADGEFDADKEVEISKPELPDSYKDTEAEEVLNNVFEQNQELAEQVNFMKKQLRQLSQGQQQQPVSDIGQDQGTQATGENVSADILEQEAQKYEQFVDNHPELTDENGEPTEALNEINKRMAKGGGVFDSWEEAYYSVMGDEVVEANKASQKQKEKIEEKNSRTAPSTSGMTSSNGDQPQNSSNDNPLLSNQGPVSDIRRALEGRTS